MKWIDVTEKMIPGADELKILASGVSHKFNYCATIPNHERQYYKNLTIADFQSLRCFIYQNQPGELLLIEPWFEAILRFCEVNIWNLEKRMSEIWGYERAPSVTVLTTAFLLEIYLVKQDLRFLNAVLKIKKSRFFPGQQVVKSAKKSTVIDLSRVICEIVDVKIKGIL